MAGPRKGFAGSAIPRHPRAFAREEQAITVRDQDPRTDLTARFADTALIKEGADVIQKNFENNFASLPRTEGARP